MHWQSLRQEGFKVTFTYGESMKEARSTIGYPCQGAIPIEGYCTTRPNAFSCTTSNASIMPTYSAYEIFEGRFHFSGWAQHPTPLGTALYGIPALPEEIHDLVFRAPLIQLPAGPSPILWRSAGAERGGPPDKAALGLLRFGLDRTTALHETVFVNAGAFKLVGEPGISDTSFTALYSGDMICHYRKSLESPLTTSRLMKNLTIQLIHVPTGGQPTLIMYVNAAEGAHTADVMPRTDRIGIVIRASYSGNEQDLVTMNYVAVNAVLSLQHP